jgi:acetylornithine deacetylase/succinyl-diaminopimelate desuccinylase-like protein
MNTIDAFVATQRERILAELKELLAIPSISTDAQHGPECRRAATWLEQHLRGLGCSVELVGSATHPVVIGEGPTVANRPTVLVYGHYDVQPPEPLEAWASPPFEPTEREGNLYARGATDDKGQVLALLKAYEAVSRHGEPPVNVRFLLEGQEESGGQILAAVLDDRPGLLRSDVVLIADGPYYAPGWPAIEVGVRGICYAEIVVRTLEGDLHSGLYGGVAPNALEALAQVLAALKTAGGRIRIPGLYDLVRRPSATERASWRRLPFSATRFRRDEVRARALTGDARYSVHERLWALPTLDVHGITGGFVGEGMKTVIPAEARAKVSLRLVPDQRAETVFRQLGRAVRAAAPGYARVEVRSLANADPVLVNTRHPAFRHLDRAFREVEGRGLVFTRSGGSLPILPTLGRAGAPVLLAGIGLPDDGLHAPNEKFSIAQLTKGIRIFARFFDAYGKDPSRSEEVA